MSDDDAADHIDWPATFEEGFHPHPTYEASYQTLVDYCCHYWKMMNRMTLGVGQQMQMQMMEEGTHTHWVEMTNTEQEGQL